MNLSLRADRFVLLATQGDSREVDDGAAVNCWHCASRDRPFCVGTSCAIVVLFIEIGVVITLYVRSTTSADEDTRSPPKEWAPVLATSRDLVLVVVLGSPNDTWILNKVRACYPLLQENIKGSFQDHQCSNNVAAVQSSNAAPPAQSPKSIIPTTKIQAI